MNSKEQDKHIYHQITIALGKSKMNYENLHPGYQWQMVHSDQYGLEIYNKILDFNEHHLHTWRPVACH